MDAAHTFFTDRIRLGKKGQVTIPKVIRDEDELAENDEFIVTHMPGGDIVFRKAAVQSPEDRLFEILRRIPEFDYKTAWKEVKAERKREHR